MVGRYFTHLARTLSISLPLVVMVAADHGTVAVGGATSGALLGAGVAGVAGVAGGVATINSAAGYGVGYGVIANAGGVVGTASSVISA